METELVTIYVYLLNEGVDVWRPVLASRIDESLFRIVVQQYDRSVETWEFEPGDVVHCEQTRLSERSLPCCKTQRLTGLPWLSA